MLGREELEVKELIDGNGFGYPKEQADKVMDAMEARIKELELALSNSREHEKALRKCFDNHRQRIKELEIYDCRKMSSMNTETLKNIRGGVACEFEKLKTRVKELEENIQSVEKNADYWADRCMELEAKQPKWISAKDRLPCEDGEYQVVYKHKNGAMVASFDEWDNDCQDWMNATDRVAVAYWAELLPTPKTRR